MAEGTLGIIAKSIHDQLAVINPESEFARTTVITCARQTLELTHGNEQSELIMRIAIVATELDDIELFNALAKSGFPLSNFSPKVVAFERGGEGHKVVAFERIRTGDGWTANVRTNCEISKENVPIGELYQARNGLCTKCFPERAG